MTINKRQFIRLDEIPEKTNLTRGDILDAVDSGKLAFAALIDTCNLGALVKLNDRWQVAAVFDFNGMVKLGNNVSKQFALAFQPQSVNQFLVIQPEKMQNWRSVLDVFSNIEESRIPYLEKAPVQPSRPVGAYAGLEVVPTMQNKVANIANGFADLASSFMPDLKLDEVTQKYPKTDSMCLQSKSITVEQERLRLDLQDVAELFGNDSVRGNGSSTVNSVDVTVGASVEVTGSTETGSVKPIPLTHPIEQIVLRVLQAYPQAEPKEIWNLIREDIQCISGRVFDIDSVIDSMTGDNIQWFGVGVHSVNELGYESFRRNTVYKVRKYLKASSEN